LLDFSLYAQETKTEENVPKYVALKYRMAAKHQKFSTPRPSKINKNLDFWYESIPSGKPGEYTYICI
jgi:hypothetical protein